MNAVPRLPEPDDDDSLLGALRRHGERHARHRAGDESALRRLAQVGVLGWMIVVPTLGGLFLGRWLDGRFQSGLFWTGGLLMVGLAIGCWSAWRWVKKA
ncbi:AtpZ/AtpI family protein [Zavarzinia compransoris]|uniref:AtpZ/AtpI family protein n=1 Tax=Zavarzinia marina TaxID=2911065 RepID=UPI001F28B952|nr:AtpZ/AtpI family protein [Zavarzinia marina]MCF4167604.1 AtpZ/AtpI family protein [Zavarzinia marina]